MADGPDMLAQAGALGDQLRTPVPRGLLDGRGPFTRRPARRASAARRRARAWRSGCCRSACACRSRWPTTPALPGWVGAAQPRRRDLVLRRAPPRRSTGGGRPRERGATRVAVTAGGPLADDAAATGDAAASACRRGFEPRGALGLLLAPLVVLLDEAGAAPGAAADARRRRRAAADRVRDANGAGVADGGPARRGGGRAASAAAIVLYGAGRAGRRRRAAQEPAQRERQGGRLRRRRCPRSPTTRCSAGRARCGPASRSPPSCCAIPTRRVAQRAVADGVADELRTRGPPGAGVAGRGRDARSSAPSGCWPSATTSPAGWASGSGSTWARSTASPAQVAAAGRACVLEPLRPDYHSTRPFDERNEHSVSTQTIKHDVRDLGLAAEGRGRIEWAEREMPVLASIRAALRGREAAERHPRRRVPARHDRDRQPHAHARGRRRRGRALRLQPALDPGRRGGRARGRVRHLDLRHQGRGRRDLLPAHPRRRRHAARR